MLVFFFTSWGSSLRKQPTFCDASNGFPKKWHLQNGRRNSILMTSHYPDLGSASDWLKQISHTALPIRSTSQIWVVTLSSVWNFCTRFSDVISQGNRWWCPEISAVFSGHFLMKWVKCLASLYSLPKQLNLVLRSSRFTVQFSVN